MLTSYYLGCDLNSEPVLEGDTTVAAFQQDVIRESDISLESSSNKLAVTNALLTVTFNPSTILP